MAGKTGVPTQLIVQSKGVPSTMTMQQLQTMMKQQNIQNVSVSEFNKYNNNFPSIYFLITDDKLLNISAILSITYYIIGFWCKYNCNAV